MYTTDTSLKLLADVSRWGRVSVLQNRTRTEPFVSPSTVNGFGSQHGLSRGSVILRGDAPGQLLFLSLPGIIGGLTSVITSTVEGVKTEGGVSGFISGLGKGLVGTVTKPVAGALDFASETAQAVRDTATLSGPRSVAVYISDQ